MLLCIKVTRVIWNKDGQNVNPGICRELITFEIGIGWGLNVRQDKLRKGGKLWNTSLAAAVSTPYFLLFSLVLKIFPEDFSRGFFLKILSFRFFLTKVEEDFSWRYFLKILPKKYSWRFFLNNFPEDISRRFFLKIFPEDFFCRFFQMIFPKDFSWRFFPS